MRPPARSPRRGIDGKPNASGGRQFGLLHKLPAMEAAR